MVLFSVINVIILSLLSLFFSSASILAIGLLGFTLVIYLSKGQRNIYTSLSWVFCISVFLMLILYNGYIEKYSVPYFLGGSDDLHFEQAADYFSSQGYLLPSDLTQDSQFYYNNYSGFVWILSWIMRFSDLIGGYHTIAFRILNVYFLIAISILVFKYFSKNNNFTMKQNFIVLYFVSLFPNTLFITFHVFRDTLNVLILFLIFYIWDCIVSENKKATALYLIAIIITVFLTYVSYWVRAQNIFFIIAILYLCIFLKDKILSIKTSGIFFFIAIIGLYLLNYLDITRQLMKFSENYSNYLLENSSGLSQMIFSVDLFPYGIILRSVYGLVSPLPVSILQITKIFDDINIFFEFIISIGVVIQIYLLPYLIMNVKRVDKVTICFLLFFLAMIITTFTFRHYILIYPFMTILIFRQYFKTPERVRSILFFVMTGLILLNALIYISVKG